MTSKERARLVAEHVHSNQTYGIFPYIKHIWDVVTIAEKFGYDEEIVIACYLHDSLEDGHISYNDIKKEFGENVAEIVYAVTDELGRNRKERHANTYGKIMRNEKAVIVKLCDRIANVEAGGLSDMYRKEYKGFQTVLYNPAHVEAKRAWDYLNNLMK